LQDAIDKTKNNTSISLVLALNYSARWEITNAVKQLALEIENGQMNSDEVTEEAISQKLTTFLIPDPELLIRTSGECRVSNFLLWQIAYTELHFTEVLWPDFKAEDLYKPVLDFKSRERRFGTVSEQLT
jgi:undecaprenyl diphosphate synthase